MITRIGHAPTVDKKKLKFFSQLEDADCGPACLRMIADFHGASMTLRDLRDLCGITKGGATIRDLVLGGQRAGLDITPVRCEPSTLRDHAPLPCILLWRENHFVVLEKVEERRNGRSYRIADPGYGKLRLNEETFLSNWIPRGKEGTALLISTGEGWTPTSSIKTPRLQTGRRTLAFLTKHTRNYRAGLLKVGLTLMVTAGISWVLPILMQRLIDDGVLLGDHNLVYLLLLAQVALVFGQTLIQFVRGKVLAGLSMNISIDIVTDFLKKLVRLPLSYFDSRMHTDLLQRIEDQGRIESFISYEFISVLFSVITLLVMSTILFYYDPIIFVVFWGLTLLAIGWITFFLKRRRHLDYSRFSIQSGNNNALYEIVTGMPEIKINSSQESKLRSWRGIQERLYQLKLKALYLNHYQLVGSNTITQLKNIAITFLCAFWVMAGDMTLGVMVSISYIIGTLTAPLADIINFSGTTQDAHMAFERLDEVQQRPDENYHKVAVPGTSTETLRTENLSFRYGKNDASPVIDNIDLTIPPGKVTAIVGTSGSGKTTLMKLLLRFYLPTDGRIHLGDKDLTDLNSDAWRSRCGVVMQNGYIYSESIASNVAMTADGEVDDDRLWFSLRMARLEDFVANLPQRASTPIGNAGVELSGGQRQRILIARAIYRDPDYLFFDEATSLLDTVNERAIMNNLQQFFHGKTVLVIAHRLSTVQQADQLIVMEKGRVVEVGTHQELVQRRGYYLELVKDQLELAG